MERSKTGVWLSGSALVNRFDSFTLFLSTPRHLEALIHCIPALWHSVTVANAQPYGERLSMLIYIRSVAEVWVCTSICSWTH